MRHNWDNEQQKQPAVRTRNTAVKLQLRKKHRPDKINKKIGSICKRYCHDCVNFESLCSVEYWPTKNTDEHLSYFKQLQGGPKKLDHFW